MTTTHELTLAPGRRARLELPDELTAEELARLRAWLDLALASIVVNERPARRDAEEATP